MAHAPTRSGGASCGSVFLTAMATAASARVVPGAGRRGAGRAGRLDVDHRIPLDVAPDRMYDESNLQALCTFGCHRAKTRSENTPANPERDAWRVYLAARMASMR